MIQNIFNGKKTNINPNIKILVACHKKDPNIRQDEVFMPIHVGKALHPEVDLGFQGDNTGENISEKNPYYSELTALYWGWKNLSKDVDYVGLAHYSRYFQVDSTKIPSIASNKVIVNKAKVLPISVHDEMAIWTSPEDMRLFVEAILRLHPDIAPYVEKLIFNGNKIYDCNMFIMNRNDFDEYCKFLFPILEEYDKSRREYPFPRQNRVIGYLAEPLLGLWITYKNKPTKEVYRWEITSLQRCVHRVTQTKDNLAFRLFRWGRAHKKIEFHKSVITP